MGRLLAISNLKGGIGKTTTVVNVGAGLALKGARVLLVDTDAQGNLSMALGLQAKRTLYDVVVDGAAPADCIVPARPNLDLLAADSTLLMAQTVIAQRPDWSRVLERTLRPLAARYDFIVIDSSGSLTPMNVNALMAATDILVPTTVEHFAIKSIEMLFTQVARVKGHTAAIRLIIPTMYDPRVRQAGELLSGLHERYGALVAPPVRINVRLSESPAHGRTIYEYDPRSRGAADYAILVEHISRLFDFRLEPVVRPAPVTPPPERRPEAPQATPELPITCPYCRRPLKHALLAGYRVAYCEHCRYKTQVLAHVPRV